MEKLVWLLVFFYAALVHLLCSACYQFNSLLILWHFVLWYNVIKQEQVVPAYLQSRVS